MGLREFLSPIKNRVSMKTLVAMYLAGEVTDAFTHLMVLTALAQAREGRLPADVSRLLV